MDWEDYINLKNLFGFQIILIISFIIAYNINFVNQKNNIYNINFDFFGISKEKAEYSDNFLYIEQNLNGKNFYEVNNNMQKDIIVGIDFGGTNTGFSYIIGNKIEDIILNKKFPSEFGLSRKTLKGIHFSESSSISMMNYRKNELDKVIYLKGIKYILNSKNYTINDNTCFIYPGYIIPELNIRNILTEYFLMLKNDIINKINLKQEIDNIEDKILWTISIPSAWNEFEKQLFKNSIINSGMKNNKLIYESEASSEFIYHQAENILKKNNNFMLIDAGGYFIDISINEFLDRYGNINQILDSKTYYLGINKIIEDILKILEDLFGIAKFNYIKKNNPGNWIRILKDINRAIENVYCVDGIEIYEINGQFKNDKGYYFYHYKNKKYKIEYNEFSVILPGNLIGNIILNNINEIIFNIDEIIKELNIKNIKLKSIVITGGFSENKIFQTEIENYFLKYKIHIEYLHSYQTAISKGLILYSINNMGKGQTRRSPITIGIKNIKKMEIILNKGDNIKNILCTKYLKPISENQKFIQLNIYSTSEEILNKGDLEKYFFGRLLLKINNKEDKIIQLTITYDIILNFYAFNNENGKEIETEFQYFQ